MSHISKKTKHTHLLPSCQASTRDEGRRKTKKEDRRQKRRRDKGNRGKSYVIHNTQVSNMNISLSVKNGFLVKAYLPHVSAVGAFLCPSPNVDSSAECVQ